MSSCGCAGTAPLKGIAVKKKHKWCVFSGKREVSCHKHKSSARAAAKHRRANGKKGRVRKVAL